MRGLLYNTVQVDPLESQVARIERAAQTERAESTFSVIAIELLEKRAKEGLTPGSVKRERRLIEKDLARPLLATALEPWRGQSWMKFWASGRTTSNTNWRMRLGIRLGVRITAPRIWQSGRR